MSMNGFYAFFSFFNLSFVYKLVSVIAEVQWNRTPGGAYACRYQGKLTEIVCHILRKTFDNISNKEENPPGGLLDGALYDFAQILAYLAHNKSRS